MSARYASRREGTNGNVCVTFFEAQQQFARELGVSKMTVSRWELGRMRPGPAAVSAMRRLQVRARRRGVKIDGHRRTAAHSILSRR